MANLTAVPELIFVLVILLFLAIGMPAFALVAYPPRLEQLGEETTPA